MTDTGTGQARRTFDGGYSPVWSPDGEQIAFVSERDGDSEIFVMDADGSNVDPAHQQTALTSDRFPILVARWLEDLAFEQLIAMTVTVRSTSWTPTVATAEPIEQCGRRHPALLVARWYNVRLPEGEHHLDDERRWRQPG